MAELASEYLAERLNSRELLALLFICEARRKKQLDGLAVTGDAKPAVLIEFLDRFGARLHKLPEGERTYLIGSHLQSAEELDIYANHEIQALLDQHRDIHHALVQTLEADSRFTTA